MASDVYEKIIVRDLINLMDVYWTELQQSVYGFAESCGVDIEDVWFERGTSWNHEDEVYICTRREPTDVEIKKRKEKDAKSQARSLKIKQAREAKERKELERLQKKYGVDN